MGKLILVLLLSFSAVFANIGTILVTKGKVEVKRVNEILLVTNGMKLFQKDEIVTQAKARVQIMLKDETIITIGPKSSFSFEEYSFDGTDKSKLTLRANRGFFRSVTGRIGKVAPERFKVKTASATIGIRGTDFSGDISVDREQFKCYSGGITVAYEGGLKEIDAGMMMEISSQKIEVKKISSQDKTSLDADVKKKTTKETKDKKTSAKVVKDTPVKVLTPDISNEVVEEKIESQDIVEDVLDVGKLTTEIYIVEELAVDVVKEDPIVEPFEITPSSEDRQILY